MKKKLFIGICLMLSVLMLGGCAADDKLEKKLKGTSGIYQDDDYKKYKSMLDNKQLDKNGVYKETDSLSDNSVHEGSIHLTFARNRFIRIEYFYDKQMNERVNISNCYVNPGDTLYASIKEINNPFSDSFLFDRFRFVQYANNGSRTAVVSDNSIGEDEEEKKETKKEEERDIKDRSKGAVIEFTIPADYKGNELSVEPLGEYQKSNITFLAYTVGSDGKKQSVGSADFYIDGELVLADKMEISAGKPYTVSLKYDANTYYFASSSPKAKEGEKPGEITFNESDGKNTSVAYEVELHPYMDLVFDGTGSIDSVITVKCDGAKLNGRKLEKLKAGQTVTVDTTDDFRLFCKDIQFSESASGTGFHYTFTVPNVNKKTLNIRVSDQMKTVKIPSVEHGKIQLRLMDNGTLTDDEDDKEIEGEVYLEDGDVADGTSTVEVKIIPDDGYYVSGRNVTDTVYVQIMRLSDFLDDAEKLIADHKILPLLEASVDTSDQFGTCVFKINGETVTGDFYIREGDRLVLEYTLNDSSMAIARKDGSLLTSPADFANGNVPTRTEYIIMAESDAGRKFSRADFFDVVKSTATSTDTSTDNTENSEQTEDQQ